MRNLFAAALLLLSPTAPKCKITQSRVFVEFADGQSLDEFESTALNATRVVKVAKAWAVDHTSTQVSVQSVHFLDKSLHAAHVCVSEGKAVHQLTLTRIDDQWTVK
jgi:hypothetical protein